MRPEVLLEASAEDHRKRPRRRGQALEAAILEATIAEIAESGYHNLRMERVAERAHAGKASMYRRWPNKNLLVAAAFRHARPDPVTAACDTGSLRSDLLALFAMVARSLDGPTGLALRGLASDVMRDPELAEADQFFAGGQTLRAVRQAVRRAQDRGDLGPAEITDRQLDAGPAVLRWHLLAHGGPPREQVLTEIVDEIVIPLLLAVAGPGGRHDRDVDEHRCRQAKADHLHLDLVGEREAEDDRGRLR